MTYIDDLATELAALGIRGRLRRRILIEIGDHLACDPNAALGSVDELAGRFADELGTAYARRAALVSFTALGIAGTLLGVTFLSASSAGLSWSSAHPRSALLGLAAVAVLAVASQLAFVSGLFGGVRAFRHRGEHVVNRSEATVIVRRAELGVAAGLATMGGLALLVVEFDRGLAGWWTAFAVTGAIAGSAALAAAAPVVMAARRVRPATAGLAGDLFADIGPLAPPPLRGHPWRLAFTVAGGLALLITAAGALQADGLDGALRGLADATACVVGFALLGRRLGLRA
jgi:hypothetical protein